MSFDLLGKGIYTIPEASRISRIGPGKITRWVGGYKVAGKHYEPVFRPEIKEMDHSIALSFLDLIELRFIDEFRKHDVSFQTIRIALHKAKKMMNTSHPFATKKFYTDGKNILASVAGTSADKDDHLLELVRDQYEWGTIIKSYLIGQIDFADDLPRYLWPLEGSKRVVIDPARRFGKPILHKYSIPTATISNAFKAEQSIDTVASWFRVDAESVVDAVEYEKQLAAA